MGEGSKNLGGYELLTGLGSGSIGTVYRAKQLAMDRLVALKVLNPAHARDPQYVERFLAEARTAARVNHPNVCQVYDVGEDRDLYYFSMELIDGPSVADMLRERGKLPVPEALGIAREMALALRAADAQGLVHRDVRPANILISDTGVAKLVDVGLAKDVVSPGASASLEDPGIAGTPHYMAPEQAQSLDVDIRSDIYSLGATLYHMLVGEPPFTGPHATAVMIKHASEPLKPPSKVDPTIRKGVSALVEMMMAKDPDDRYADPDELVEAIDAAISGKPAPASGARRARPSAAVPSTARAHKGTPVRKSVRSRAPKGKGALLVPAAIGGAAVVVAGILIAIFAFSGPSAVYKTGDEKLRRAELLLQEGTVESLRKALAVARRIPRTLPAGSDYERLRDRAERIEQLVERKMLDAEKELMNDLVEGVRAGRTTPEVAEVAVAALGGRYGKQETSPVFQDCISRLCDLTRARLAKAGGKVAVVAKREPRGGIREGGPVVRQKLGSPSRPLKSPRRTLAEIKAEIPEGSAIAVVLPEIEKHLAAGEFADALGMIDVMAETVEGKERRAAVAVGAHIRGEAERAFAVVAKDVRSYIEVGRFELAEAELRKAKGSLGFAPYAGKIDARLAEVRTLASARASPPPAPPRAPTPAPITTRSGRIGGALSFDGKDDYVDLPDGFADFTGGFTVAVWAYPTAVKKWARFIDIGNGAGMEVIVFSRANLQSAPVLEVHSRPRMDRSLTADGALRLNEWQHLAATIDARGNAVIYRNGTPVKAGQVGVPARVKRVHNFIARSNWKNNPYYEGRMDDVRIYNRALGPDLVGVLASGGGARGAARYLLGHWKFDDGAGNVARDSSGRGNHGKIVGARWAAGKATAEAPAPAPPPAVKTVGAVSAAGLVGHWKFDERTGATARDSSGRGNHGRIAGGRRVRGKLGYALAFDGKDDHVTIPNKAAFDITGNITVAAWIKVASFTKPWQAIVTKGNSSWRLHRKGESGTLTWDCTGLSHSRHGNLSGSAAVDDGRWHHVAGVYDGTRTYLYVDGKVDASVRSSRSIRAADYPVCIGHNAQRDGRHFHGLIDDVRVYARALSGGEVKTLAAGK